MYGNGHETEAVTLRTLAAMKARGEKIVALTAYDASFAAALDAAGVDLILVGDSLGMVVQGHATTLPVSLEHMAYHCAAVARGVRRALLVADMPFASYPEPAVALRSAARLMAEGVAMVKLEGSGHVVESIRYLVDRDVPVCAHLGLTPQSVHKLGGFRVQGRADAAAKQLREDARAIQQAGAQLLVLECVPAALAAEITAALTIPTIGIGAGVDCDGQILVCYDMLGITPGKRPRFSRDFLLTRGSVQDALCAYVEAVRGRTFPTPDESF
jgi:3-methyl-2-oxobutanoate hydroxymethyltransferase